MIGLHLDLVVGARICSLVPSLTRIYCSVIIALANFCWLLNTRYVVYGGFRTNTISDIIIDNVSVAVIIGLAHMAGKKSTMFDI